MKTLVLVVLVCWANCGYSQSKSDQANQGGSMTAALYDLIRGIAFPEHPALDNQPNQANRFILLMPGKVLNYFDYYPGREYTKFIQEYSTNMKESIVPPHVMEKWFDLADVMPSAHPLFGQDSGRSLANEYTAVLQETTITNIRQQGDHVIAAYNQAVTFLKEELVADPENVSMNTTRLNLYERYRDQYNDRRLEMEDQIEQKRKNLRSLDYELWFQRHYPSLVSKVESAYTRWLVFGEKQQCDIYITSLDSGTSARNLEDARVSLRSSGVSSLDRTRTIYPVSFEPSDWYKYLLPKYQGPSRAQLNHMLARVSAKINVIDNIIDFYNQSHSDSHSFSNFKQAFKKQSNVSANVQEYLNAQLDCMYQSMINNQFKCPNYDQKARDLLTKLSDAATAMADREDYILNPNTKSNYLLNLKNQKDNLIEQQTRLLDIVGKLNPSIGGILDADQLAIANLSDTYKDDNWLQFSFDSRSDFQKAQSSSSHEFTSAGGGVHILFFHIGGSYTHSKDTSHFDQKLASSQMKAKGKLLRVNIKRPWFKPEIFEDPTLNYVDGNGEGLNTYASPGKDITEDQFIAALTGSNGGRQYRLPEYVTSFLLARDIELEFSEVDAETVRDTLDEYSHTSGSGGFLFFRASASVTKNNHWSQVTTQRTANGMSIKIPGTQLIGYYTQKLPRFPLKQE